MSATALKRAVAFREPDPLLHVSLILLDDIVQLLVAAEVNPARQRAVTFQGLNRRWTRRVLVEVRHSR